MEDTTKNNNEHVRNINIKERPVKIRRIVYVDRGDFFIIRDGDKEIHLSPEFILSMATEKWTGPMWFRGYANTIQFTTENPNVVKHTPVQHILEPIDTEKD